MTTSNKGKIWYLDLNHRNPTTATVEQNFTDLPVRHDGLNQDPSRKTLLGNPHLNWAPKGETNPDVPSLCHKASQFIELQNKGYSLDSLQDEGDESNLNPICKSCEYNQRKVNGKYSDLRRPNG